MPGVSFKTASGQLEDNLKPASESKAKQDKLGKIEPNSLSRFAPFVGSYFWQCQGTMWPTMSCAAAATAAAPAPASSLFLAVSACSDRS